MSAQQLFKCLTFIEPAHDDQPVGDAASAADRIACGSHRQRHHAKIDVRRQSAVEGHFRQAGIGPALECGEVKIGKPYWLFELVDAVAGHENPGHMGLPRGDCLGRRNVAVGTA